MLISTIMQHRTPLRGVVFDKDGTLIDFSKTWPPAIRQVTQELCDRAGVPDLWRRLLELGGQDPDTGAVMAGSLVAEATVEDLTSHWMDHHPEIATAKIDAGSTSADQRRQIADWYHARCHAVIGDAYVPPTDLPPLFETLHARGIAIGVATNDILVGAEKVLNALGVRRNVDFVAACDSGYGIKPDPGMITAFCQALALAPAETAMVGDAQADLIAGRAAGCGLVVGVLTGASTRADLEPLADLVIDSIADLPGVI
ncbi:MAG: HAD family hydrolase [Magnetospiraceae bacterium]